MSNTISKLNDNTELVTNSTNEIEYFSEKYFEFENKPLDLLQVPTIINSTFGILNLKAIPTKIINKVFEFVFMIDCSGSMSDFCSDGRTKMQHIIHTLKNIIAFFLENSSVEIYVSIYSFDEKIYTILEHTEINDNNYSEVLKKIDKIRPMGLTNIEFALQHSKKCIAHLQNEFSDHEITQIFMSDGEITSGSKNNEILNSHIDTNIYNNFIGFGIEHDAQLLKMLSSNIKGSYYFIDKLENSGFVYGEILHGVLYRLLINIQLNISNGLIYDYDTNNWVETLCIKDIVGESNKIYHIVSNNVNDCSITLTGYTIENELVEITIRKNTMTSDLMKYIFRQRTMQHLYVANQHSIKFNQMSKNYYCNVENENNDFYEEQRRIKKNLSLFIEELKKYMADNNLTNDNFYKNLCDDIYVTYKTIGTVYGEMYSTSRKSSQGTQRCYTTSHVPNISRNLPNISRNLPNISRNQCSNLITRSNAMTNVFQFDSSYITSNACNSFDYTSNIDDLNNDILKHEVSQVEDAPYIMPMASQIMRSISENN